MEDDRKYNVAEVLSVGANLSYVYDLGDNWRHAVRVDAAVHSSRESVVGTLVQRLVAGVANRTVP